MKTIYFLPILLLLTTQVQAVAAQPSGTSPPPADIRYGNFLPERVGTLGDVASHGILFQPDRELLYDFDTHHPMDGIHVAGGQATISSDYFITRGRSLRWRTKGGGSIVFDAGMKLQALKQCTENNAPYYLSMGLFLASRNDREPVPAFRAELIGNNDTVIHQVPFYLHKAGWNILSVCLKSIPRGTQIKTIRLTKMPGAPVSVLLDNVMLGSAAPDSTAGIFSPVVYYEKEAPPSRALSAAEIEAFKIISDRIMPPVTPVARLPEAKLEAYKAWHDRWHIERKRGFVNGQFPLIRHFYTPGTPHSQRNYMWEQNCSLCSTVGQLGIDYAACQDSIQKDRLRTYLVDMVWLARTYSGVPSAWYNGRGFVKGVYYGRDTLAAEGLLKPISKQIIMQYGVNNILDMDPIWEKPPFITPEINQMGPEFPWKTTADDLNTGVESTVMAILLEPDSAEKSIHLKKLSTWYSRVALAYGPGTHDCLKPDGSRFHHWGDHTGYGYGGFRGASDVLYWFSGTPFRIEREAHERLCHMAEAFRNRSFNAGDVGGPDNHYDNQQRTFRTIALNLARSGTPDGQSAVDPFFAGMFMAANPDYKGWDRPVLPLVETWKRAGIRPLGEPDALVTQSYAGIQTRRKDDWALTIFGISKSFWHMQYARPGFLFHSIGGLGLVEKNRKHAMWQDINHRMLYNNCTSDNPNDYMTAGYHPSFSPCVTAVPADWKKITQLYYQYGTDPFVGGVSLGNRFGVFAQPFDARTNPAYRSTPACGLSFRKTYFTFDRRVVALGRNIGAGQSRQAFTGVLQEEPLAGTPGVTTSGGCDWKALETGIPSERLNWAQAAAGNLGVWFFPGQTVRGETGTLAAARPGSMTRLYLEHGKEAEKDAASYGLVYLIRPGAGETARFAHEMASLAAPIRILKDEKNVQVVADASQNVTGYVFYRAGETHDAGPIFSANVPCLAVAQMKDDGKRLDLAVSDPDMHINITPENPFGYSQPTTVHLTVTGLWKLKEAVNTIGLPPPQVKVEADGKGNTLIQAVVKDGLAAELHLRASGSLGLKRE